MNKFEMLFLLIGCFTIQSITGYHLNCPKECKCYDLSVFCTRLSLNKIPVLNGSAESVDLRYNLIKDIRPNTFSKANNLRILYLSFNNLTIIESYSFHGLSELEDLYLNNNNLQRINSNSFSLLRRLRNLYLYSNKLKELNEHLFRGLYYLEKIFLNSNQLSSLKENTLEDQRQLRAIRLDKNDLICDCDLNWLWKYVTQTQSSKNNRKIELFAKCDSPLQFKGKHFLSLSQNDLKCEPPSILDSTNNITIKLDEDESIQSAEFVCNITGNPLPSIEWSKFNLILTSDNEKYEFQNNKSKLIVKNVKIDDSGQYQCIARNKVGEKRVAFELKVVVEIEREDNNIEYSLSDLVSKKQQEDDDIGIEKSDDKNSELKFLTMPSDTEIVEGSTALLTCSTNNPNHKIVWMKDGDKIKDEKRNTLFSNGDLEIKNVRVEDEGFYVCSISDNKNNFKYAQAELIVLVKVTYLTRPIDQEAAEGNSVEFFCTANGMPEPKIIWQKNGVEINNEISNKNNDKILRHYEFYKNNRLLRINDIDQKDDGIYTCVAENQVNRLSTNARLTVKRPTAPYFTITQQNVSTYEDHPIRLECFAEGDPKPQVLWYKNGMRIKTEARVYFDSFGYLIINQVRVADTGEYICKAVNKAGESVHKFYLTVKDIYGSIISNVLINSAIETAKMDVNRQYQATLNSLNDRRKPKTSSDLLALLRFPKDKTLNLVLSEEIYERALDIIFRYASNITFNLTNKENFVTQELLTHRQLQRLSDLSGCHRHKRRVQCSQRCLKYRTFDGTCNNLANAHNGAANTALKRLLPAQYQNGFSTPKGWNKSQLYNGYMLPNSRDVSTYIITTSKTTNDTKFTHMLMQWGQFLDHDLTHTVMAMSLNRFSNGIACRDSCTNEQPCFPIEVMSNDTLRTHLPGKCMEFVRSSAVCGSGETSLLMNKIHQREQINQLTAFIDASNVYGSNDQDAFDIRERVANDGKLKIHFTPRYPKGLLPFNLDTNMDCQRENTTTIGCFLAGDYRANEQLALLAIHNLWVRQHNTIVQKLKEVNPKWSSEQLFQEARKIVGAQMQIITFEHWLPYILGDHGMKLLGKYKNYDPKVDATIANEFATAAFRFGHALIQPFTFRLNESFQPIPEGNLLLRDSFFAPQRYFYEGGLDPLMRGLFGVPAKIKMPREIMNSELTERLFHITRSVSQDLAALNIQRGRDHGLPSYTEYRRFCNMSNVKNFEDLKKEMPNREVREILKKLYGDVRNIDLWAGGILEETVEGSKLGPLFMCIIVDQMKALRDGDRFWYENPEVFTPTQLTELKKTSLAKIICENGDNINLIQPDVFLNAKFPIDMVKCSSLEEVSLEPWRNCCQENTKGLCGESSYHYIPIEAQKKR